jgi:HAD superfamily hydrolase (TIGR01509 family)
MKIILVDAINTFLIKEKGIFLEMYNLLEKYDNKKIILTNADDKQIVEFGLVNLPYEVFSLKHNPNKVNPWYFEIMLNHFNLNVEDVIYFEHNEDAVKSAESLGIVSFYYDKNKKDLIELKKFLDDSLGKK